MNDTQLETERQAGSTIRLAALPIDDDARDHADSALPIEMIAAGADALDACRNDLDNYVAGQTPDWDSGMIAVRVFRAMTAAGLSIAPQQDACGHDTALSVIEQPAKRIVLPEVEASADIAPGHACTADERRLLEHAQSLNPHGIGTKCATGEDIDVAKGMVAKGWLTEKPDGRFITDVGRRALDNRSEARLTRKR